MRISQPSRRVRAAPFPSACLSITAVFVVACGGSIVSSNGSRATGGVGPGTGGRGSGGASDRPGGGGGVQSGTGGTTATGGRTGSGGARGDGSGGNGGAAVTSSGGGTNAGTGGGGGASIGATTCRPMSPTPATGAARFPYPQHRLSAACIYPPTCNDADAVTGWQKYKTRLVVADGSGDGGLRVLRPENSNDSVSEGIAYGMLFAVYLNDKPTFDGLWKYAQKFFDSSGLMHWHIDASRNVIGQNSATDSDEDMAFALVMADKQWTGYTAAAMGLADKVVSKDFEADGTARGGDAYGPFNPSYLAPAFYRVFASYTGNARWNSIVDKSYQLLAGAANGTTGLVPDWTDGHGPNYTYDAARTPFRIGLDACWHNEPRAVTFAQKISTFFAGVGVANIKDGYALSGMLTGQNINSTFIGPAGVGGMAARQEKLVSDAYAQVAMDVLAGTESYYNLSWAMFTTLMMTGNFIDFTAASPQ